MDFNLDISHWWWLQTRFGVIIFTMFFLTWGLIIINLFLVMLALVKRVFRRRPTEQQVTLDEIENIGRDTKVNTSTKKTPRKKVIA